MILVISEGGRHTAELSALLDEIKAEHMFHFDSFDSAGNFGKGNAVVGKLSYRSLARTIRRCGADMIIDMTESPHSRTSLVALNVADDLKLPLLKYIEPVVPGGRKLFEETAPEHCRLCYSYDEAASIINNTIGNTVFYAQPVSVRPVAERVFDRKTLFAPIEAGNEFDVDLALEFGIPLLNVKGYDGITGEAGIYRVMSDCDAKLLVTDSAIGIEDKLSAVGKLGADIIFVQNTGFEYKNIFDDLEDIKNYIESENTEE